MKLVQVILNHHPLAVHLDADSFNRICAALRSGVRANPIEQSARNELAKELEFLLKLAQRSQE